MVAATDSVSLSSFIIFSVYNLRLFCAMVRVFCQTVYIDHTDGDD
jgi:hypothetical protein